jgi:predicted  nucleic acid-binding Zn ribbon protein
MLFEAEDTAGTRFVVGSVGDRGDMLATAETYRIENGLGVDPDYDIRDVFSAQFAKAASHDCPECGSDLAFDADLETPSNEVSEALDQ